ncbi:MAG: DUF1573 domain-containing protein [Desulfobacterales bacterium]|nr:DUF1573 domain-containing protein [Desulfobacterales bacterium]
MVKKIIYVLIFISIIVQNGFCGEENKISPSIFFEEDSFDFNTVIDGTIVLHTFILKNNGKNPLKIEKVNTD